MKRARLLNILLLAVLLLPLGVAQAAPVRMYNIWATWCPPCVQELPELGKIARDYEGRLSLIGVQLDGDTPSGLQEGNAMLKGAGATYANAAPNSGTYWMAAESRYVPATFFLDASGKVLKKVTGSRNYAGWAREIEAVLNPRPFLAGDVNDNGRVELYDLELLIDYIVHDGSIFSWRNADSNRDGELSIEDTILLITALLS